MPSEWSKYSGGGIEPPKRNAIIAGLSSGVDDLQGLGYSGIAAIADTVGADGVKDWANKQADRNQWESQKNGRPDLERIEDVAGKPSEWLPYLGYQVGKQLPNIVGGIAAGAVIPEVAVPAGLSRLAAVAPKWMGGGAAGAAEGFAAKKTAVQAGERLASQLTGGAAWNYGQSVGSLYQAAQDGGDMENAGPKSLIGGVPYALMETAPEAMLAARVMGGGHAFTGNLATRMAKAGGMQAASGATSELGQTAMENAYNGNMTDEQKASSYLNAGVAGGLVEGLLGMSGGVRSRARAIESGKPANLLDRERPTDLTGAQQQGLFGDAPQGPGKFSVSDGFTPEQAGGVQWGWVPKPGTNAAQVQAIIAKGGSTLDNAVKKGLVEWAPTGNFDGVTRSGDGQGQNNLMSGVHGLALNGKYTELSGDELANNRIPVGDGSSNYAEYPNAVPFSETDMTDLLNSRRTGIGGGLQIPMFGEQTQVPQPTPMQLMPEGIPAKDIGQRVDTNLGINAGPSHEGGAAAVQAALNGETGRMAPRAALGQVETPVTQHEQQLREAGMHDVADEVAAAHPAYKRVQADQQRVKIETEAKAQQAELARVNNALGLKGTKFNAQHRLYQQLEQLKAAGTIDQAQFDSLAGSIAGEKPADPTRVRKFISGIANEKATNAKTAAATPAQTNTGPEGTSQGTQPNTAAGGVSANAGTANAPVTSSAPVVVNQSGQGALTTETNKGGKLTLPNKRKVKLQIQHPTNGLVAVTSMSQLPPDAITAIDEVKGGKGGSDLILAMNDSGKIKAFKKSQWDLLRLVRGLDEQGHATRTPMTGEQAAAALGLKSRSSVTKALNELLGKGVALKEVKNQVRQENASTAMEAPTAFDTDESGKVTAVQATGKDDLINNIDAQQEYLADKADAAPGEELEDDAVLRRIPASTDAKPVDVIDARDKFDEIAAVSGHTDWDFGSLSLANKAAFVGKYIAHFDPRLGIDFLNDAYDELRSEYEKRPAAGNTSPKIEAPSAERPQLTVSPEVGERVAKEEGRKEKDVTDVTPKEKPKVTPTTPAVIEGNEGHKLVFESQEQVKRAVELQTKKIEKLQALLKCLTGG